MMPNANPHKTPLPAFPNEPNARARGRVAAQGREHATTNDRTECSNHSRLDSSAVSTRSGVSSSALGCATDALKITDYAFYYAPNYAKSLYCSTYPYEDVCMTSQ